MSAREDALAILDAAVRAADPAHAVERALRLEGGILRVGEEEVARLAAGAGVRVVGAGKAARGMAEGALRSLGARVRGGSITVPHGLGAPLAGLEVWEAGHPLPDAHGLAAAAAALRLARTHDAGDLLLCLLSGGASALWAAPADGVALAELRAVTGALLRAGAPIGEINAVRKHLSRIAGGQLARAAAPARVVTLAISDVPAGAPAAIGSGPTAPDDATYADALEALARHGVAAPPGVRRHLQAGLAGAVPETVRAEELQGRATLHVVASVADALAGAAREAERLGYTARVLDRGMQGEARLLGREAARQALRARRSGEGPLALLWGGESTVRVLGDGHGGRNQELALAAALALDGEPGVVVAALGTDGVDGPTPAAGAAVNGDAARRIRDAGIDPEAALHRNDSHPALRAADALISTGPTGTNVGDVVVAVVDRG